MDAVAEAAMGGSDDAFPPNHGREVADARGAEIGVLDHGCCVGNDTGDEELVDRKLHLFPDAPFVFVASVGGLDGVALGVDGQQKAHPAPIIWRIRVQGMRRVRPWFWRS